MNWAVVAVCLFSGIAFSEKEKKKGFGICNSSVCQVTANKIYLVNVKEQIDQD